MPFLGGGLLTAAEFKIQMKSVAKKVVFFLLVAALIMVGLISCSIDQRESETTTGIQYFTIEPASILESLSQGKKDVFTSINSEPRLDSASKNEPVAWKQTDYFQIAEALHNLIWGESLETWNLYRMNFTLGCDQVDRGLQYAQFVFFKVINEQQTRIEHFIEIDPSRKFAQVMETKYEPNLANWKAIDLSKVKVSAREALQIAEKDGGQEKRLAVKNACSISVGISRDTVVYDGWLVDYSPSIFLDKIDPITGK